MATRTIVRRDGRRIIVYYRLHIFYELAHLFLGQFWIQLEHLDYFFLLVETTLSPVNLEVTILVDENLGCWQLLHWIRWKGRFWFLFGGNLSFYATNLLFYSRATLGDRDARSLWWAGLLCGFLFENSLGAANGARGFDLWCRRLLFGCRNSLFRHDLSKPTNFLLQLKEWVVQDVLICGKTFVLHRAKTTI